MQHANKFRGMVLRLSEYVFRVVTSVFLKGITFLLLLCLASNLSSYVFPTIMRHYILQSACYMHLSYIRLCSINAY